MEVVGEASTGVEAVEAAARLKPDVVVIDVRMPEMGGLEALRCIKRSRPQTVVIMMTAYEDEQCLSEAVKNGASGFVLKASTDATLREAILGALRGEDPHQRPWWQLVLDQMQARAVASSAPDGAQLRGLTHRELEILRYMAHGLRGVDMARLMGLHEVTVRMHCCNAFRKLGVSDRTSAVLLGIQEGWLNPSVPGRSPVG